MSNAFCHVIYGCPLPTVGLHDPDQIEDLWETCREEDPGSATEVGWHCTYGQNEDWLWFGASLGKVSNGFGPLPEVWGQNPNQTPTSYVGNKQTEVTEAFYDLPESTRDLLGHPKHYLLVGLD